MSKISITVAGNKWEDWEGVSIFKSVDTIAASFAIQLSNIFEGGAGNSFKLGSDVVIEINDKKILTGFIDKIEEDDDEEEGFFVVKGRDVGDLVDCCFVESVNEWKNQTILVLISELCKPFGIRVISETTKTNAKLARFKAMEGEKVFESIYRLCNEYGLNAITNGNREIVISEISDTQMNDKIEAPGNVINRKFRADDTIRFSHYITKGQGIGTPEKSLDAFLHCKGIAQDKQIKRYRPTTMFADVPTDNSQAGVKSNRELHYYAGLSREFVYTVEGWEQSNNEFWAVDSLVDVEDDFVKVNEKLYIREIEYTRFGDEEKTVISCVFPYMYDIDEKVNGGTIYDET
jgi:prophage tail gpP-like protein